MTVEELIGQLELLPRDLPVVFDVFTDGYINGGVLVDVKVVDALKIQPVFHGNTSEYTWYDTEPPTNEHEVTPVKIVNLGSM